MKTITTKKYIFALAVLGVIMCVPCAFAEVSARDALIAYSGTDAFTKLPHEERQACMEWLVYGGEMDDDCIRGILRLTSEYPDAVSSEQRRALIAAVSDTKTARAPAPVEPEQRPDTKKVEKDNTGAIIAAGIIGIAAGLIIHNNVRHHKRAPAYAPEPPRPGPDRPPYGRRPSRR